MFKLNGNYEVDRSFLNRDYLGFSPGERSTIKTLNSQIYNNIPREDTVFFYSNSYLELNFEVVKKVDQSRYANGDDKRLLDLGSFALFSIFKLTTSSGKHQEDISHAHIIFLKYKLISSAKDSDDLSIGFDQDRERRQRKLTINRNIKGKYHVRTMLKDVFGFAAHHEKATYGLG